MILVPTATHRPTTLGDGPKEASSAPAPREFGPEARNASGATRQRLDPAIGAGNASINVRRP